MQGLNDVDERIIEKDFILDLLIILDQNYQITFHGFYLRFLKNSIPRLKCSNKMIVNIKKLLLIFYKVRKINFIVFYIILNYIFKFI